MDSSLLQENTGHETIIISGIFLMFFMSMVLLLFFYFSKKKVIEKELEKKDLELQYQQELIQATMEVQEEERKRIAQDLHDEISSKLNVVSINTYLLTNPDIPLNEFNTIRSTIIEQIGKALESSRRIAHDLLPPVLDKFGLDAGIKELCLECSNKLTKVKYSNTILFNYEDKTRHLHVFRILQELINNSIRHGKASDIAVSFDKSEDGIVCTYTDNGKGFDVNEMKNKRGLGMKNIESRIIFLEGSIVFDSEINKGCKVVFTFN